MNAAAVLLAAALILSGCGKTAAAPDNTGVAAAPAQEAQVQAEVPAAAEQAPLTLNADELQAFTSLFETPEYNGFLADSFRNPSDINWDAVLQGGAGIASQGVSEGERSAFLTATGQGQLYGDLSAIRKADLADYIRQHTGLETLPEEDTLSWVYLGEYDSFYRQLLSDEHMAYTCVSGEKADGRYKLRFELSENSAGIDPRSHRGVFADRDLTLVQSGDRFIVESNAIRWDDHSDPEQTFEVELPQFDGPVRFITYSEYEGQASAVMVKDGRLLTELSTWIQTDSLAYLKKITAVDFLDFNADGMKDIALIGDSDYGRHVLLFDAAADEYLFRNFADLDGQKVAELGADFTAAGIRSALLGGQEESAAATWQEAYAQIAKLYSLSGDRYLFDLPDADGDGTPELVIDDPGYALSLFTFKNGAARCLMHSWPYGAGGNAGYSYIPGTGIYYNANSDYAGAVRYEYYMSDRGEGEIQTDFWVKSLNFNDLDGNGEPSEYELSVSGEYAAASEYHSEADREMSGDEIKAAVDRFAGAEKKPLAGTLDYESLLACLGGNRLTDEQALSAVRNYCCLMNPDLEAIANAGEYPVAWEVSSGDAQEIVVLFRSYTGAMNYYHIDPLSGDTTVTEFVPGIMQEEQQTGEHFNVRDYLP